MKTITAAIVDDETPAIETLQQALKRLRDDFQVVGVADTYDSGLELIRDKRPNIVFLDIEMPTGSGFKLAKQCDPALTKVVFVSAHLDRGVEAFRQGALGYLGKPVRFAELDEIHKRYWNLVDSEMVMRTIGREKPGKVDGFLVVTEAEAYRRIPMDQIVVIEAKRSYCTLYIINEKPVTLSKSMKEVEELLPKPQFLRTSRSYMVQCRYVRTIPRSSRGHLELVDGSQIPVSREYMEAIRLHLLHQLGGWGARS